jgi:hypothetical protein
MVATVNIPYRAFRDPPSFELRSEHRTMLEISMLAMILAAAAAALPTPAQAVTDSGSKAVECAAGERQEVGLTAARTEVKIAFLCPGASAPTESSVSCESVVRGAVPTVPLSSGEPKVRPAQFIEGAKQGIMSRPGASGWKGNPR